MPDTNAESITFGSTQTEEVNSIHVSTQACGRTEFTSLHKEDMQLRKMSPFQLFNHL